MKMSLDSPGIYLFNEVNQGRERERKRGNWLPFHILLEAISYRLVNRNAINISLSYLWKCRLGLSEKEKERPLTTSQRLREIERRRRNKMEITREMKEESEERR